MTSFPNVLNVHNVLNDRTGMGSATSDGPNVLNTSFALKYAPVSDNHDCFQDDVTD